jgi:pyrroline-5-carboxylate reductase
MVEETFHGALALLDQTGSEPQDLREAVTSPGGSTAAALAVFVDANLPAVISRAVDAAAARAQELAGD